MRFMMNFCHDSWKYCMNWCCCTLLRINCQELSCKKCNLPAWSKKEYIYRYRKGYNNNKKGGKRSINDICSSHAMVLTCVANIYAPYYLGWHKWTIRMQWWCYSKSMNMIWTCHCIGTHREKGILSMYDAIFTAEIFTSRHIWHNKR